MLLVAFCTIFWTHGAINSSHWWMFGSDLSWIHICYFSNQFRSEVKWFRSGQIFNPDPTGLLFLFWLPLLLQWRLEFRHSYSPMWAMFLTGWVKARRHPGMISTRVRSVPIRSKMNGSQCAIQRRSYSMDGLDCTKESYFQRCSCIN